MGERFLVAIEDAKLRGAYVDPAAGRVPFAEWAERAYLADRPHGREDLVFTAPRGGPLRESKFVPGRFEPAIRAANQTLAQLDPDGPPSCCPRRYACTTCGTRPRR